MLFVLPLYLYGRAGLNKPVYGALYVLLNLFIKVFIININI